MNTAWLVLVLALVLNESCNGATVKKTLQRRKREFVIPSNLEKVFEEQKDGISPGVRKVWNLLTKNVTEEEFFAALLTIGPSQFGSPSTKPEMVDGSGDFHVISDDEDLGEGSGGRPLEGQIQVTTSSFSGSPGFGPTEDPLGSTPSPEMLLYLLGGQDGGTPLSLDIITQLLQTQGQEDHTTSPEMLTLLLQQKQQIAQGQNDGRPNSEFLSLFLQSQQGPEGGIPSPEMLSILLQQHGQQVGQEGTPSPEFLAMILKLQQEAQKPNATIPFPVSSGEDPFGQKQEFTVTCNLFERKAAEDIILCEEITRPIYEKCFSEAELAVTLPFVSSPADFTDGRPVQAVLHLLKEAMKAFQFSDFGEKISQFDLTVQEADIEKNGSIKACMQENMKEDIYADCNASSNFECYMESCVENKSRSA